MTPREELTQLVAATTGLTGGDARAAAERIAESEWLRAVRAEAWDEGMHASGVMLPSLPPQRPRNPYRASRSCSDVHPEADVYHPGGH